MVHELLTGFVSWSIFFLVLDEFNRPIDEVTHVNIQIECKYRQINKLIRMRRTCIEFDLSIRTDYRFDWLVF